MLSVLCVCVGPRYADHYVTRLRDGVARWLRRPHRFAVLADRRIRGSRIETIELRRDHHGLGWFAKMALLDPLARGPEPAPALYLDLDTVVVGDLEPIAVAAECVPAFGVTENFTRLWGKPTPCAYGSCVMAFAPGWGEAAWLTWDADRAGFVGRAGQHGDQHAIEAIVPRDQVTLLNRVLPEGYLLGHRELYGSFPGGKRPGEGGRPLASVPAGAALVIFGGPRKPDNCDIEWVRAAWEGR